MKCAVSSAQYTTYNHSQARKAIISSTCDLNIIFIVLLLFIYISKCAPLYGRKLVIQDQKQCLDTPCSDPELQADVDVSKKDMLMFKEDKPLTR